MSRYGRLPAFILRLAGIVMAGLAVLFLLVFIPGQGNRLFNFDSLEGTTNSILLIYVFAIAFVGVFLFFFGKYGVPLMYYVLGFFFTLAFAVLALIGLLSGKGELIQWLPPLIAFLPVAVLTFVCKVRKPSWSVFCILIMAIHFFGLFWLLNVFYGFTFAGIMSSHWAYFPLMMIAFFFVALFSAKYYNASYGRVSIKERKPRPAEPTRNWKERGMLFSNKEY